MIIGAGFPIVTRMAPENPASPESTESPETSGTPETSGIPEASGDSGDSGTPESAATPEAPSSPADAGKQDSKWATCCGVVAVGLVLLLGLGIWGLSELEEGLDGYGQLEKPRGGLGAAGSASGPLSPGASASYEDGLTVSLSQVRRQEGSRVRHFTLTFENDTDDTLRLAGFAGEETPHEALDVRAGKPMDDEYAGPDDGSTSDWLNSDEAKAKLMAPLKEDDTRVVPIRVTGDTRGMAITVEVTPQDAEFRDAAYWQLTLD